MTWEIAGITVAYDEEARTVTVDGHALGREQVFRLQAVLRSLYNHLSRQDKQATEDAALRSLGLDRLHRMPRRE